MIEQAIGRFLVLGPIALLALVLSLALMVLLQPWLPRYAMARPNWAKSQGGDTNQLGIMGFCRGGRTVWEYAAHNKDLKAGVAFYGSLVDPDTQASIWPKSPTALAPQMQAPVLGLYGEADQGIPLTQVDAMKAALQGAGKTFEIKVYQGAPHGFHADYRASYRKEAAEEAWKEMIAWFKKYKVLS